jgi:hypothetical protein
MAHYYFFADKRPLFRSSTKAIVRPKSSHSGFELCPALGIESEEDQIETNSESV